MDAVAATAQGSTGPNDARRVHVDQQEGDALLRLAVTAGADHAVRLVDAVRFGRPLVMPLMTS